MKFTPELNAIERELSAADGDPKILQGILERLEVILTHMDHSSPPFQTATRIRTMLGQAQESLGNPAAAYGHFSYAAHYAEMAEMPESASLKEKVAELQPKLPPFDYKKWAQEHGPISTAVAGNEE